MSQPMTVTLTVSDRTEIQLPDSVTIPAGVASIHVPITSLDDNRVEPTRAVQIFAMAPIAAWCDVQCGVAPNRVCAELLWANLEGFG